METKKIVLVIAGFVMGMLCTGLSAQPAEDTITPNQPSASESTDERTDNSDGEAVTEDADEVEPASGPGLFEVDEEAATRALERSLVQSNALLLAPGRGEVSIDFSYSFDLVTQPVFVDLFDEDTEESVTAIGLSSSSNTSTQTVLGFQLGLPFDSQISLSLPLESAKSNNSTRVNGGEVDNQLLSLSGSGDLRVGILKGIFQEKGWRPDMIASITLDTDTGSSDDGVSLGSEANELSIGFSLTKRQDPLVFTLGAGYTSSESVDDFESGSVSQITVSAVLAASPYTSLQTSVSQISVGEASFEGESISGSDSSFGILGVGAASVVGRHWFINADLDVGLTENATDYTFSLSISRNFNLRR